MLMVFMSCFRTVSPNSARNYLTVSGMDASLINIGGSALATSTIDVIMTGLYGDRHKPRADAPHRVSETPDYELMVDGEGEAPP